MNELEQDPQPSISSMAAGQGPKPDKLPSISELSADSMQEIGASRAQEARGVWENVSWQGLAAANAAANAITNVATTTVKLGAAVGSTITDFSPMEGWNWVGDRLEMATGERSPGAADLWGAHWRTQGNYIGRSIDEEMSKKLGTSRVIGDTVGALAVFAKTPELGKIGSTAAQPLATWSERALAKAAAKRGGVTLSEEALAKGTAFDLLAKNPEWKKAAGMIGRTEALLGRNAQDILGTAGANIAQSYMMAPDDEKLHAVTAAALVAPLMVPVARVGQWAAGASLAGMIAPEGKAAVKAALNDFEAGVITLPKLDQIVRANSSAGARGMSMGLSTIAEGTAFMGLTMATTPQLWETWERAQNGEPGAWGELLYTYMGTMAGVATAKMGQPGTYNPLFKALRPDLNTLSTAIEAEANRRLASQKTEEPTVVGPEPSVPGEPVDATVPSRAPTASERQALIAAAEAGDEVSARELQRLDREGAFAEADRVHAETRAQYGWAEPHTVAAMRGGWKPEFHDAKSDDVWLTHGKDFSVRLSKGADGQPTLHADPRTLQLLKQFGVNVEHELLAPSMAKVSGRAAMEALDGLALLSTYRRLQGDLTYQRLGYREVEPGIWSDDARGQIVTMQLDGSTAYQNLIENKGWTGRDDTLVAGEFGDPQWGSPTSAELSNWLTHKHVLKPDNLVDGIIGQALTLAHHGQSFGADQVRQFLTETPFEALQPMLRPGEDKMLALRMGALAAGNDNYANVSMDLQRSPKLAEMRLQKARETEQAVAKEAEVPAGRAGMEDVTIAEEVVQHEPTLTEHMGQTVKPLEPDMPREASTGAMGGEQLKRELTGIVRKVRQANRALLKQQTSVLEEAIPDSTLPRNVRRATARAAQIQGESQATFAAARRALKTKEGKEVVKRQVAVKGWSEAEGTIPQWVDLFDARTKPQNRTEEIIAEGGQAVSAAEWNASAAAGMTRNVRGETVPIEPLGNRKSVTQRVPSETQQEFLQNKKYRDWFFERLSKANPDTKYKDPKTGEVRSMTAADRKAEYLALGERKVNLGDLDNEAAMEFQRRDKNVPYKVKTPDGKTYEIYETNPFKVVQKLTERQSARIAHVEQFGQEYSPAQRATMLKDPNLPAKTRAQVERGGSTKALNEFAAKIRGSNDPELAMREEGLVGVASNLLDRSQGVEPVKTLGLASFVAPLSSMTAAIRSASSFIRDIPDVLRMPAYVGWRRTAKALAGVIRHPVESITYARRMGAIDSLIGDYVLSEAKGIPAKISDAAGWLADKSEKFKGAVAAKTADNMIADAKAGKATINDLQVVGDILNLNGVDLARYKAGDISPELHTQLRRELTQLLTSRGRKVEASSVAANPNVRKLVNFMGFSTRRMDQILRTIHSVKQAGDQHGWMSKEALVAMRRLIGSSIFGIAANGIIGNALAQTMLGLFAGKPWDEGIARFGREIWAEPVKGITEGVLGATLSGPLTQAFNVVRDPLNAKGWADLTVLTGTVYHLANALFGGQKKDWSLVYNTVANLGFVPFKAHLANLASLITSAGTGSDQNRFDAAFVRDFKRDHNIVESYSTKQKPQEFYDAIQRIQDHVAASGGDVGKAVADSMADLRKALELAPEESVAGAIEGHQLVSHLDNEQREALAARTDVARMNRIYHHDDMLRQLARAARKMEGTNPTEWESELDNVSHQASLGASDRWGGLVDRALDESAQRVANREAAGDQIQQLADKMALYPEQMEALFTKAQLRSVQNARIDSLTRSRRIQSILRNRMGDRVENIRKERRSQR